MKILSTEQIRKVDAFTIEHEPIKSVDLMERASLAFVDWFVQKYYRDSKIIVITGSGNNGGDALAIARLLHERQFKVEVLLAFPHSEGSVDYGMNLKRLPSQVKVLEEINFSCDVIIDGLFGSGLTRPITGEVATLVDTINNSNRKIISIDIASGLSTDGIKAEGLAIMPSHTISFQLPKLAFMLPENNSNVGNWEMVDIGLNNGFINSQNTDFNYFTNEDAKHLIISRTQFAHKGNFGHALIIGGSYGKIGANVLASKACLRSGAGLVTSLVPTCGYSILQSSCPEVMCLVGGEKHLVNLEIENLKKYAVLGIGPGIGIHSDTLSLFLSLLKGYKNPMVIDADALNLLSQNPELIELVSKGSILTPHVGEFNRLMDAPVNGLDRIKQQQIFSKKYGLVVILKGAHSSVSNVDGQVWFNSTGNPGMATAGSGDVLTGIITGLLSQGYNSFDAARLGVYLHGKAGDIASNDLGEESLIASDIVERIPLAFISIK